MPAAAQSLKSLLLVATVVLCQTASAQAQKGTLKSGAIEVPYEVARPQGKGPFPPVLYIHAKRGYDEIDRAHIEQLAVQGFLVLAPDWQSGHFIERWPDRHYPETEADVEAALDTLLLRADACRMPAGIVGVSRGGYYALRLAAKRPEAVAAMATYYGHFQNPNAPEGQQLFSVAPEVKDLKAPLLQIIGDADFELRRMNNGRAFYSLVERGATVEIQMYPMARRAFDFRNDATPEEKTAARHARERVRAWLARHMRLGADGRCG
ncbi:MAG: dienelactone hydrolase [Betaproteobacteria bacterium HGW-Betaproteobacteria-14]|nr:MAG: dienelactone hydrolase [Betaproteobacteria bacterium HGW-Betaproteobacteria-14]PKO94951.1 MAG: dienelactone hydrolase [Betaproteobacteria bacterium HGW-Betaproteobacteria-10]